MNVSEAQVVGEGEDFAAVQHATYQMVGARVWRIGGGGVLSFVVNGGVRLC